MNRNRNREWGGIWSSWTKGDGDGATPRRDVWTMSDILKMFLFVHTFICFAESRGKNTWKLCCHSQNMHTKSIYTFLHSKIPAHTHAWIRNICTCLFIWCTHLTKKCACRTRASFPCIDMCIIIGRIEKRESICFPCLAPYPWALINVCVRAIVCERERERTGGTET